MVSRGTAEANKAKVTEHGLTHVLLQKDREVSESYKAHGTPTAVVIKADGTIGSPVSGGAEAIRTLVSKTTGTLSLNPTPTPAPARPNGNGGNGAQPQPVRSAKIGQAAPEIALNDLDGNAVTLADFKGKDTLVLFWNPGCGFCSRMVDDLKKWEAKAPKNAPSLLVVSTGTVEANKAQGLKSTMVLDQGFNVGRSFGAGGTPSAVLVDKDGKIASDVAVGSPNVLALANGEDPAKVDAGAAEQAPRGAKKGEAAPAFELPDLDGNNVSLAGQKGKKTMLVFWNPGCGFCRRMIDDVKSLEANPPKDAPDVILISTGTADSNREMGLASTRPLLDQGFNVGRSYGASGTPSAVLIDAKGKIASDIAVGAPNVLALAGVKPEPATA